MNQQFKFREVLSNGRRGEASRRGFALVVTVTMMVLLLVLAVSALTLSSIALRQSSSEDAVREARANARMALMVAIGRLQEEMGPDMRVTSTASILDGDPDTETIENVANPYWLGSYKSWSNWLNDEDEDADGKTVRIQDTYGNNREAMFRRWLVSLPPGDDEDLDTAKHALADDESVLMVGAGSAGLDTTRHVRAHLIEVKDETVAKREVAGRYAWWVSGENQKARADLATDDRKLDAHEWEVAQGNTAESGVGAIDGFSGIDGDESLARRMISVQSLRLGGVDPEILTGSFHDVTDSSNGLLVDVRRGGLKKDLSLLFELRSTQMPSTYRFNSRRDIQEPSIRPMSKDLLDYSPRVSNRHFQSWTNMRHFYRMYQQRSDAYVTSWNNGATDTQKHKAGSLNWDAGVPDTGVVSTVNVREKNLNGRWGGSDNYWRVPVLAKITFIYSLLAEPDANNPSRYRCAMVYTPIFTFWNPYNVRLRIPNDTFGMLTAAYKIMPYRADRFLGNRRVTSSNIDGNWAGSWLQSSNGRDIVFEPGEIRLFSHDAKFTGSGDRMLMPGFDPQAIGGYRSYLVFPGNSTNTKNFVSPADNPGVAISFSHSEWGGNVNHGNTAGSICHHPFWGDKNDPKIPLSYNNDWFPPAQQYARITPDPEIFNDIASSPEFIARWDFTSSEPLPVAYSQMVIKGASLIDYESANWASDWRGRNWLYSPPFYFGSGMYASLDADILETQRLENPYVWSWGPMSMAEMPKVVPHIGEKAFLGSGSNPFEKVTRVAALELPSAPVSSLAGFSGMRINPGWIDPTRAHPGWEFGTFSPSTASGRTDCVGGSKYGSEMKLVAYQSGVTGPGIGNSFVHPMIKRDGVYSYLNNSVSPDPRDRGTPLDFVENDTEAFSDYWDHAFLLNDALWDEYFLSSLANQVRPSASGASSLSKLINSMLDGNDIPNSRFVYHDGGMDNLDVLRELTQRDGYLKAAGHLIVKGMFNVNSTSVDAWYALFAGIRQRQAVYRDENGFLRKIEVPDGKRIALSRLNTAITDQEMSDPEFGVPMGDTSAWSGVRFLDDDQLKKLAEECVKQVKLRGPFLNYGEFINRRLSEDELGMMGALQAAIDYDDDSPDPQSINFMFKNGPDFMMSVSDAGSNEFSTPEMLNGSRFTGIPGYVIQSDLLKPIGNSLTVRDDTFRIRAYGDSLAANGQIKARAWCEAIVERKPEYYDPENSPDESARELNRAGQFVDNAALNATNRKYGRRLGLVSFRWLSYNEV